MNKREKCAQCGAKYPEREMTPVPAVNGKVCLPCDLIFQRRYGFAEAFRLVARHTAAWARRA